MSVSLPNDAHQAWTSPYAFESENNLLGVRLTAGTVSSNAQLVGSGRSLILTNPTSTEAVYVALGLNNGVAATLAHFPVLPFVQTVINLPANSTGGVIQGLWIAAISAGGTGVLCAHLGYGV